MAGERLLRGKSPQTGRLATSSTSAVTHFSQQRRDVVRSRRFDISNGHPCLCEFAWSLPWLEKVGDQRSRDTVSLLSILQAERRPPAADGPVQPEAQAQLAARAESEAEAETLVDAPALLDQEEQVWDGRACYQLAVAVHSGHLMSCCRLQDILALRSPISLHIRPLLCVLPCIRQQATPLLQLPVAPAPPFQVCFPA